MNPAKHDRNDETGHTCPTCGECSFDDHGVRRGACCCSTCSDCGVVTRYEETHRCEYPSTQPQPSPPCLPAPPCRNCKGLGAVVWGEPCSQCQGEGVAMCDCCYPAHVPAVRLVDRGRTAVCRACFDAEEDNRHETGCGCPECCPELAVQP